ncbi:hypothetical protein [Mycoplasma todarodis]|uniref:Uncharacterized protein n=1 Tax=Mycoplasma todarodis TaxID=1937191 RepID=A0A4R0XQS6_9MOLU|nr:hypothetical protein [Mycoplasma todarodis]TCG11949.1 hypothetical protein C4B25_00395 [Mycoplasma todarodis]
MITDSETIRTLLFQEVTSKNKNFNTFCTIADSLFERAQFFEYTRFPTIFSDESGAILFYANAGIVVECYETIKKLLDKQHEFSSNSYQFHNFLKFNEWDTTDLHFIKNIRKIIIHPNIYSKGKGRSWITKETGSTIYGYFYDGAIQYNYNNVVPTCDVIKDIVKNIYTNIISMLTK